MKSTLREHWGISTFRLAALFGLVFTVGNFALLGLIYWQTSSYLVRRIDKSIHLMVAGFKEEDPGQALVEVKDALTYDLRKSNLYGLFAPNGEIVAGNMDFLPRELTVDGKIHQFSYRPFPQYSLDGIAPKASAGLARALARHLSNGEILVVGRDFTQLAEIRTIILHALIISGAVLIAIGLSSGFILSMRPLHRINTIRTTARRIVQGELSLRMPVSGRHDEVDMLASIVNLMLEEIERLLTEVKSVADTLAHDLRTPLTRVRLLLYRVQQQTAPVHPQRHMIDKALMETDALLGRFRALLRISEIENRQRKAGFALIDPCDILASITELFDALAEDKAVKLDVLCSRANDILADPDLLCEALSNLVDNAIKFTPAGGSVTVKLAQHEGFPRIDIIDTGCGIGAGERDAVFQRFYRSGKDSAHEGYGLGLSIVAAIIRLHGFSLKFQESGRGTHVTVFCASKPVSFGPDAQCPADDTETIYKNGR